MNEECAQALVELLFLTVNLDDRLSMPENELLEKALASFGWTAGEAGPVDVGRAYQASSGVAHCEARTEAFLRERTALLRAAGHSAIAFEWIGRMLGVDGLERGEKYFLKRLQGMLFD
jgi:hypothetical protein